jgi:hypothetical protein
MCETHLFVQDEDPVNLVGGIDAGSALQFTHGSDSLASYSQCLHAAHDDLNTQTGTLRIKLVDFAVGGYTWQLTASHNSGAQNWSRGSGFAYYDFGTLASEVEVDILATSNHSPAQTKSRKIWVKTMPTDGLQ